MSNLTLTEIWIYPIKSLGGIRLSKSRVFQKGLQHDRRWMLIDEENNFMTQRLTPSLCLFQTSLHNDHILISKKSESIRLEMGEPEGETISSKVWDDPVEVREVSKQHSEWFSDLLAIKCRLVSFPEQNQRPVDPHFALHQEQVSLADAYPLLIIGEASLADLNSRLKEPVPMNRFRPNLVFSGGQPYEEDIWKQFSIGMNSFAGVKPCARCVMTTIRQDTAEKGAEPLATLSKYRRDGNKVLFGQNVLAINENEINEGDEIVLN